MVSCCGARTAVARDIVGLSEQERRCGGVQREICGLKPPRAGHQFQRQRQEFKRSCGKGGHLFELWDTVGSLLFQKNGR